MSYTEQDARRQLLEALAVATNHLAGALASLTAAYEQLDVQRAGALERQLFRPVQRAYGAAQRTHAGFADGWRLPRAEFTTAVAQAPSTGAKGFLAHAAEAVAAADRAIAGLQDSLLPVEVGDAELRAGLREVRQHLDGVAERARELVRMFGR